MAGGTAHPYRLPMFGVRTVGRCQSLLLAPESENFTLHQKSALPSPMGRTRDDWDFAPRLAVSWEG